MSGEESDVPVRIDVREGKRDDGTYSYAFTYERATLYEFKFDRAAYPAAVDPCHRCYKSTPIHEQVNVGVLFHRQCFRCRVCGIPLTMQTFYRNDANGTNDKEVYCKTHVGKGIRQIQAEGQPIDVTHALPPGGSQHVIQLAGKSTKQPSLPSSRSGAGSPRPIASPRNSPRSSPRPGTPKMASSPADSSLVSVTPRSMNGTWMSGTMHNTSLDYSNMSGSRYQRPRPPLQSFQDFSDTGVFSSQATLEQRHREEEDRLQRFLLEEREKEMRRLDESIGQEKEVAAMELLSAFEQMRLQGQSPNLMVERERIEEHFNKSREDQMKTMIDKIATEEKTRSAKMLERHGMEMMQLIAEKDRVLDRSALFDHTMRPAVVPPESKKAQLYSSPAQFEAIDKRAIEIAKTEYGSFTELVRDLTRDCANELQKARALFRWVIAKDLGKHNVHEIIRPNARASILKGVRSGKETYHQLFKKLCNFAGLHCEIILGFSKGAGYKPGMRIEGATFRNSWTAVAIDGNWRIVNCTWAARHVTGHKDDLPQMFHKYDEFYFLTDPEDYIYQHYPDDSAWQLMDIPLPFSEFQNLPVVKSPFFNYGLKFYSNYGATLNTDTGMVEIRVITPKILGFGSLLEPYDKSGESSKSVEGRTLLRLVKNEAIFTINLPKTGLYQFSVYTGDYWQSECLESACSFLVNCKQILGVASPPYPPVPFYGPTPVMEKLKMKEENQLDPLIVSNGENLEISYSLCEKIKLTHTFQYFDVSDNSVSDIDRYVFLRSRTDALANYMVRCPKEGFYIFSLYAADGENEAQTLDCAYRYLIICQEPNPAVNVFPKTFHRWQRCTLHEPVSGDLMTHKRYTFRVDVPKAVEVFLVIGEIWHHLKRKLAFTFEGNINTGGTPCTAKIYARFSNERDSSLFAHLLDYELVDDAETEI
ncbi:hillarin-like isoform X1 [Mizuhopecten yessoensis]|nr:hillarin-like isoform X1 [Mizuhopecten yessoensis]